VSVFLEDYHVVFDFAYVFWIDFVFVLCDFVVVVDHVVHSAFGLPYCVVEYFAYPVELLR